MLYYAKAGTFHNLNDSPVSQGYQILSFNQTHPIDTSLLKLQLDTTNCRNPRQNLLSPTSLQHILTKVSFEIETDNVYHIDLEELYTNPKMETNLL